MAADKRIWVLCPVATAASINAALQPLGPLFSGDSMLGRFPDTDPTLAYAGWQNTTPVLNDIDSAISGIAGVQVFRGALAGVEEESSPSVVQESEVATSDAPPGRKHSRRAAIRSTYRRLGLGVPPPDAVQREGT